MGNRKYIITVVVLWTVMFQLLVSAQGAGAAALVFKQLTTNSRVNPLGIPVSDISFGWSVTSDTRGTAQQSYQVIVGTDVGLQNIWDSGQVASPCQVGVILPSAIVLQPATRYYWQVRIWDTAGNASGWSSANWFETGLLSQTDWQGADWITRPNNSSINPASWTNYTVTVDFTLIHEAFGIFLRSSVDGRNSYMMQVNVTESSPVFKPHKCTNGTYSVLATINLSSYGYTNASLTGTLNTLRFDVSGGTITTRLNGTIIDTRTNVAYLSGLVGFRTWGAEEGSADQIQVVDSTNGATLLNTDFSNYDNGFSGGVVANGALVLSGTVDAIYVNYPSSLPLLRGQFEATKFPLMAKKRATSFSPPAGQIITNGYNHKPTTSRILSRPEPTLSAWNWPTAGIAARWAWAGRTSMELNLPLLQKSKSPILMARLFGLRPTRAGRPVTVRISLPTSRMAKPIMQISSSPDGTP